MFGPRFLDLQIDKEIGTGLDAVYGGQRPARAAMTEVARKVNAVVSAPGT